MSSIYEAVLITKKYGIVEKIIFLKMGVMFLILRDKDMKHLFFVGLLTRILWSWTEKKCPTQNGIILRNIPSDTLNYYHIRSFLIKYGKNKFFKGLFPWLVKWFFNFVGSCKIGKGTTVEEEISADKFIDMGKNCYVGINSVICSHTVEGVFGRIPYFEIKIEDNVTFSAFNLVGPGCNIKSNSYLLPMASVAKHQSTKGNNYYFGLPMRRIFTKKVLDYLKITKKDFDKNNIQTEKQQIINDINKTKRKNLKKDEKVLEIEEEDLKSSEKKNKSELALDFATSSAISRVTIKFLPLYILIFWLSGMLVAIYWYEYLIIANYIDDDFGRFLYFSLCLPFGFFISFIIFILGCLFFSKLFLIFINLIHKPKEGVFRAEKGDFDFEFWCLRKELKKLVLWLMRNCPLPWIDALAFRWFGIKMDFSSHLPDSWCDAEFIKMGRRVLIGQGAVIMSSMVVGKYLIIKKVIFDDYTIVGGMSCVSPGTIIGKDSLLGGRSETIFGQFLEPGWIYFGIPCIKLKPNKLTYERKMTRSNVDDERAITVEYNINFENKEKDNLR